MLNKKKIITIVSIVSAIVIAAVAVLLVFLLPKEKEKPTGTFMQQIGIGGGGSFFNPMMDPNNDNFIYVTCDMGGLYYSHNKGKSWNRTFTRGVYGQAHISQNGNLFLGGYGLYASYDNGKSVNMIYPKDAKYEVSRCGWNENIMIAENFDNDYIKAIYTLNNKLYFITISWGGVFKLHSSDFDGNNLNILESKTLINVSDPVNGIAVNMVCDNSGIYYSLGNSIHFFKFEDSSVTEIYSTTGTIKDIAIIDNKIFVIDDLPEKSKILYTTDFVSFTDIMTYNTLPTNFTKYERDGTFNWHFKEITGNNLQNIFLSFEANVNEYYDTVEGIMHFDGTSFSWVFDNVFKTKHELELPCWSYGSHGPFYGIYINPNNSEEVLVSNIETVYLMNYDSNKEREVVNLHCYNKGDTYTTNGLDVQTTYSVKYDPFNSNHIVICSTDMGLQHSFDGGLSWKRMNITEVVHDIYNTCYDLYFDKNNKDVVYGLWSSLHDAPYYPYSAQNDYVMGEFAISYDGGLTWDFTYSTGIPANSVPVKLSVKENGNNLIFAVATFNNGFYISYNSGKDFISINEGMADYSGYIFGEDIIMVENDLYCLVAPVNDGYWNAAKLYKYNMQNESLTEIDLKEIVIARSLTYSEETGLLINVIPTYHYEWMEEFNDGSWVNDNGGIYKVENGTVTKFFENYDGIFNSAVHKDGRIFAVDTYGKIFVYENETWNLYVDGLFTMLKNVCFSDDGKIMYVTSFGGGTYQFNLEFYNR